MASNTHHTETDGESADDQLSDGESEYDRGEKRPLDHGVKVRAKVKRGTDTRDQDELLIEGRGETAAEAAADFEATLARAEANNWARRLRTLQPDADEPDDLELVKKYRPGAEVYIKNDRTGEQEVATADEDGVLRDEDGRSYGPEAYSIVGEAGDDHV